MPRRRCPVPDCTTSIDDDKAMCRVHWYRVPAALRQRVWATFRRDRGGDEHIAALREAIQAARLGH